jgi:hypothetical protein
MDNLTREDIEEAFYPSREIDNPAFFAGRKEEIKTAVRALNDIRSFIPIFGIRGIGKTSLAKQVKLISEGDETLQKMLYLDRYIETANLKFDYLTHYITCDKSIKNTNDLIKRIVFGDESSEELFDHTDKGNKIKKEVVESFSNITKINFKSLLDFTLKKGENVKYEIKESDDTIQNFRKLLGQIQKENFHKKGFIIFIDEFDLIEDKTGFGSLIKACTNDFFKFCIIGISDSFATLISDHESISRFSYPIKIDKMLDYELSEILKKAENRVSYYLNINEDARDYIVKLAGGFPYFVHLIGKESFYLAHGRGQRTIDVETVDSVFRRIAEGRLPILYETLYLEAIDYSEEKEVLLLLFAEEKNTVIPTKEIYKNAKELGITSPAAITKSLVMDEKSKPVLQKISNGRYSFIDPIFKVYVRIRGLKNSKTNTM